MWAGISGGGIMIGVGWKPLRVMVSQVLGGSGAGKTYGVTAESVHINRMPEFERESAEEASVEWFLRDGERPMFSR